MSEDLQKYFLSVQRATIGKDGPSLSRHISLRDTHVKNQSLYLAQPEELVREVGLEQHVDEVVCAHLKVMCHLTQRPPNYMEAFKEQAAACKALMGLWQPAKPNKDWGLPSMYRLCLDLGPLARSCEKHCRGFTPGYVLEQAAESIMSCFRICAVSKESVAIKRQGMMTLVNQLFKIYFRINKLILCQPLIKAIETNTAKDSFPLQDQITYKYFVGRLAMLNANYSEAMENLSFAFTNCPTRFARNKRLILLYLVPVKMLLGYLPSKSLLERYDLLLFHDLSLALKAGQLTRFEAIVRTHLLFLIRSGIYLLLMKLKYCIYRNLFKKVFLLRQSLKLDINDFLAALQFVGVKNMSLNEVHCILVNLIYEGKIRGYISHEHNKLVVSKLNPFPSLISK